MLTENEWNTINNILLELYTINDLDSFAKRIMKLIKMLIPYNKGWFLLLNDTQKIQREKSYFIGFEKSVQDKYIDIYYDEDYLQYIYGFTSETSVYKDTDILASDIREKTDFYINFLHPENIVFGCGIILVRNSKIIGIFNLFRGEESYDFNDKEIYILNIIKKHIENILNTVNETNHEKISSVRSIADFADSYGFTSRETDVFSLLYKGLSNQEISDTLIISVSTVKKHIYNIYTKTGASSRGRLMLLFLDKPNIELK
ncbi:MAG: helix-turn-helix transcriptional regulator [Ruminococcus flavefaciens]|nr:helix-turn-helix transcriptional regulator [Ruminococcus flavefaciens]MCM1062785.1 helix-turn-helix transcriptional regulator [Eubacterium sp.]